MEVGRVGREGWTNERRVGQREREGVRTVVTPILVPRVGNQPAIFIETVMCKVSVHDNSH